MAKRRRLGHWLRRLAPRLARALAAAVLFSLPVFGLAVLVREQWTVLLDFDRNLVRHATNFTREHGLRDALVAWQTYTHPKMMYLYAVPLVIWAWVRGLRSRAVWGTVTMLVGWNLGLQAKSLVERARPVLGQPIETAPGYSFPSGHAFNVTMMTVTSLIMLWPLLRSAALRVGLVVVAAALIVLTMLDRVFLGVHYPSDVTAGFLFATALAFASYRGFTYTPRSDRDHHG